MGSMMRRTTFREIKDSLGRFMAIFAIIALGVGFFSGLKAARPAMVQTVETFLSEAEFYDLHLLSTLGFTEEDVTAFAEEADVRYAEGVYSFDVLYQGIGDAESALKTMSLPEHVNGIRLMEGRLPASDTECVIDDRLSDIEVGDTITVSDTNDKDTRDYLTSSTFTVVGKVQSSLYINFERGSTTLESGKLSGFVYLIPEAFDLDYFTDVYVRFDQDYALYDDAYDDYMDDKEDTWDAICEERVTKRYRDSLMSYGMPKVLAEDMDLSDTDDASYYVLGRETNAAYVCFESDSEIVESVSKVFPVFFILVAVLVCMTTMNRMVEEQRTMIGMFKALGYSEAAIMGKYMIYSGTAAVLGCVFGFFAGTYGFPLVIWKAYQMMYIDLKLSYVLDWQMALLALFAALICSVGTTWATCRYELSETAAGLMRPKAPKPGKRVLLERVPFVWKHLKFLQKVSVRNIFRYKKRFFMMLIGIGGCTSLVLTGFGINDSVGDFAAQQYEEIEIADGTITLSQDVCPTEDGIETYAFASTMSYDLVTEEATKTVNFVIFKQPEEAGEYIDFHDEAGEAVSYPGKNEAMINRALAELYDIGVGDQISVRDSDMKELQLTVSGIFENHVYNYVFISPETYEEQMGEEPEYHTVYFNLADGVDAHAVSAELMKQSGVSQVTINQDMRERVDNMMSSLDYIVLVVILSAAALAFIVLYNLTNINITERIREIATVKVLGFFRKETSSYVFRENRALTALGIVFGLGLGVLLHRFVMAQIRVDMVFFDVTIRPISYVYSVVLTFFFNFCVNLVMSAKLDRINMAESLKSVE